IRCESDAGSNHLSESRMFHLNPVRTRIEVREDEKAAFVAALRAAEVGFGFGDSNTDSAHHGMGTVRNRPENRSVQRLSAQWGGVENGERKGRYCNPAAQLEPRR